MVDHQGNVIVELRVLRVVVYGRRALLLGEAKVF